MAKRLRHWEHRKIRAPRLMRLKFDKFDAKEKLPSEEYLKKIRVLAKLPTRVKFHGKDGNWLKFNAHRIEYSLSVRQARHYALLIRKEIARRIARSVRHLMADVTDDDIQEWVYGRKKA